MSHGSVRWERSAVLRIVIAASLAIVASACGDDDGGVGPTDGGGVADAGGGADSGPRPQQDAGVGVDAGPSPVDAGGSDAGTDGGGVMADAGTTDGGTDPVDGGPTTPWIDIPSRILSADDDIVVSFGNGPGNALDWIGMYRYSTSANAFQMPGGSGVTSVTYEYVPGSSGTVTLDPPSPLASGVYFIGFFENDGYSELSDRIVAYVGAVPTLSGPTARFDAGRDAYVFPSGSTVEVTWSDAAPLPGDWIGIYDAGDVPGPGTPSSAYDYVSTAATGTATFSGLADGEYFATYLVHDYSYFEPAARVRVIVGP